MRVYIGADHRGFKLKEVLKVWLKKGGHDIKDEGAYKLDPKDDYTLYAEKVGSLVADNENARGILICGSGVGVDVVANKIDGVRASMGKSSAQVKAGRNDDNMNVLVIASDFTKELEARKMVKTFLETKFGKKDRYKRRLSDIEKIEANN